MDLTMPLPDLADQVQVVEKLDRYSSSLHRVDTIRKLIAPQTETLLTVLIETKLQRLEKRYPMQPLGSVVDETRGISYGVVQTGTEYDGGVPTLRAGDLRQFEILLRNVKRVDPGIEAKYQRTRLRGGEVLLRIRGGLGETAVCPTEMVGGNVSREVAVIPVTEALDPTYVMYAIAAPSRQEFLRSNLRGTSYVGINLKDVRRLELPVPPLGVQSRFVQEIASLRRHLSDIETEQQAASDLTGALLPSLLAEAFAASNGS
jgi:type I restriction enzyme S subunit